MRNSKKTLTAIIIVSSFLTATVAFADGLPHLSARWWEFATSIPTEVNPLLDTSGANCMVGQRGSTWFLAGTFSGGTVSRSCSVPAGEALFFPIVNSVNINAPNVCGQGTDNLSVAQLRAMSASFIDGATNLSAEVDGKPLRNLIRVRSAVFAIAFPADNIFDAPCGGPGTVPAGIYSPAVDDGIYVLLQPLSVGTHTIHLHAEVASQNFVLDVTYNLTVIAVGLE